MDCRWSPRFWRPNCLVWECKESERDLITLRILQHILFHHLNIQKSDVNFIGNQFDGLLVIPSQKKTAYNTPSIIKVFDKLVKQMKRLSGIPLGIKSILPLSPGVLQLFVYWCHSISLHFSVFSILHGRWTTQADTCGTTWGYHSGNRTLAHFTGCSSNQAVNGRRNTKVFKK